MLIIAAVVLTLFASVFAMAGDSAAADRQYFGEPVPDRPVSSGERLEDAIGTAPEDEAELIQIYNQDWIDYTVAVDSDGHGIFLYYVDDPNAPSGHRLRSGTKISFASGSKAWDVSGDWPLDGPRGGAGRNLFNLRGVLPTGTRLFIRPEAANWVFGASVTAYSGGDSKSVMIMQPRLRAAGDNPPGYVPATDLKAGTIIDPVGTDALIQPPLDYKDFVVPERRGAPIRFDHRMGPPRPPMLKNPGRFYRRVDRTVDFGLAAVPGGTIFEIANNDWIPYRLDIDEASATVAVSRAGGDDSPNDFNRAILPPGGCLSIPSAPRLWTLTGEGGRRVGVPVAAAVPVTVVSLIHDYRDSEFGLKVWVDDRRNDETAVLLPREPRAAADWPAGLNPADYANFKQPDVPLEKPYYGPTVEDLLDAGIPPRRAATEEIRLGSATGPLVTLSNNDWVDYRVSIDVANDLVRVFRTDAFEDREAVLLPSGKKLVFGGADSWRIFGDEPKPHELKTGGENVVVDIVPYREMADFGARIQVNGTKGSYPKLMTPWRRDAAGVPAEMGGAPENVSE